MTRRGVLDVFSVERRKLSSQLAIRLLVVVCVLLPVVAAGLIKLTRSSPADTLYGGWVQSSGFALSLFILSFAAAYGLPVIAAVVGGDLFSSEDRHGTWKLVLTRSCTREELFAGKLLAGAAFTVGFLLLTATAAVVAGAVFVGPHALVSLSGTTMSAGEALGLVVASWLVCLLPTLAFASLAALLSIATRNGIAAVLVTFLVALAVQLLLLIGSGVWAHMLLIGSASTTWRPLFLDHSYYGQLLIGLAVSVVWIALTTLAAWQILRRRDFAGTSVSRRVGWATPVAAALAIVAVILFFSLAGSWGPVGVTAARLKASFVPTFNNLTILQQEELGRTVAPGAQLNIALPSCVRHGTGPTGPGDWTCSMQIIIPSPGSLPPQPTTVTYEVTVLPDGCYKAASPPSFIAGQRTLPGTQITNPLYVIYGCFNTL